MWFVACAAGLADGAAAQQKPALPTEIPATFRPVRGEGLLRRLTFNFSIGQAF